ncbi:MAG TPA: hypothetical protein VMI30_04695 [Stellaceae bacterium]|nr:hypothetical protein [Stellaceae bacterium]
MGILLGMFREVARLGVTRAAAFFYAVAVGVAANIVIANFSPHDGVDLFSFSWLTSKPAEAPVATATIAPKPVEAKPAEAKPVDAQPAEAKPVEVSAPAAFAPQSAPAPVLPPLATVTAPPLNVPAPPISAATALPPPTAMTPPPLKPAALPSVPPSPTPPVAVDGKPASDKPTADVETAATATSAAPISLLPSDEAGAGKPAADQAPTKPEKPGPGSGGLY